MPSPPGSCSVSLIAQGLGAGYGRGPLVLSDVNLTVARGQTVGLSRESGAGKSTLARVLVMTHRPAAGRFTVDGDEVTRWGTAAPKALRRRFGILFQSPRASVDPRFSLPAVIAEPLRLSRRDRTAVTAAVEVLAERVGLSSGLLDRRPHQVSDGQLQRACLARAIALDPAYLVCDEMTAMLDASSTAQLVLRVREWQASSGAAVLAISHDRALVNRWADHVVDLDAIL